MSPSPSAVAAFKKAIFHQDISSVLIIGIQIQHDGEPDVKHLTFGKDLFSILFMGILIEIIL